MSMMSLVKNSEGQKRKIITQQYDIGLYVAVYDMDSRILEQFGLDCDNESEFHEGLENKTEGGI